jgi:hypothetical protein
VDAGSVAALTGRVVVVASKKRCHVIALRRMSDQFHFSCVSLISQYEVRRALKAGKLHYTPKRISNAYVC